MLDRVERLLVGVHRQVGKAGDAGQELPAAEFFGLDRLADRDRGDAGARDRHDRAFAHDDEVRHRRVPGRGPVALAPSSADTHGVSRSRWYSVGSCAMIARPAAPMRSGMRAPVDSPRNTSGKPRLHAACFTCLIFFMLTTLTDEAPSTVKSFDTSATSRPAIRARIPRPCRRPASCGALRRGSRDARTARFEKAAGIYQVVDALARVEVALRFALRELFAARPSPAPPRSSLPVPSARPWLSRPVLPFPFPRQRRQSTCISASFTTFAHLAISALTKVAN